MLRPGSALFAVLFLVVIAGLSAAVMLTATAAERTATVRSVDELELRLAIRSAIAVATADLAAQREAMLAGEVPEAPDPVRIDRGEGEPAIVVEFLPARDGRTLRPEAARLDLNWAPVEALRNLPGMPEGVADAIVRRRTATPFRSVAEAAALPSGPAGPEQPTAPADEDDGLTGRTGLTTADLPDAFDDVSDDAAESEVADSGGSFGDAFSEGGDGFGGADWLEMVTVFSADPAVMAGASDPDALGRARVNINAPWSDAIERALEAAAGDAVDDSVRTLFIDAPRFGTLGSFVGLLGEKNVPRDLWPGLLDAVTVSPDPYRVGLVDLNSAPVEVLSALPGMDRAAAVEIVDARERLDLANRLTVLWPVFEGILSDESFERCVDLLSVRSLQWRFEIRATFESGEDDFAGFDPGDSIGGTLPEADEFGVAIEEEAAETGPSVLFEVVLDFAGVSPRVAYLRERTAYDFAIAVAALPGFRAGDDERGSEFAELDWADEDSFDAADPAGGPSDQPAGGPISRQGARGDGVRSGFGGIGDSSVDDSGGLDDGDVRGLPSDENESASAGRRAARRSSGRPDDGGSSSDAGAGRDKRTGRWVPSGRSGDGGKVGG